MLQSRNKALAASPAPASPPPPRRPIARLDATTYRPARLGAGPLAALLDQPADHAAHLHRRADDYSPPQQQLIPASTPKQSDYDYEQLQEQQRRNQQQLRLLQQQLYQQQEKQKLLEQQSYQQRLYEQQLYEEQALGQRDPERFQLVPYQGEIAQRFADRQQEQLYQAQRRISQPEQYRPEERLSAQRYQELNAQRFQGKTIVDPIQRSIDLDLDGKPRQ